MSEKGSEPLISDSKQAQQFNGPPPPCYTSQPNYVPPPQAGYVIQGQPAQQGFVVQPPPPYGVQFTNGQVGVRNVVPLPPAQDHLLAAILVTVFCFFPTGILAIIRASDAKAAASYGDMHTAERHSKSAKKMINISIIAGIFCTLLMIALFVVYFMVITNNIRRAYNSNDY
ncbi:proline-rich transmembrane protein 1-like [Ruditapes philippinarum]|uniref:proline-rich transmembrane protein 1-like n=1 Tax=Ruditapes philippinarum TaxID=129788 RepID=UPI00295AA1E0|nr:proline-rich transmembrane protein 1-like [Ruditapes philippinarum]